MKDAALQVLFRIIQLVLVPIVLFFVAGCCFIRGAVELRTFQQGLDRFLYRTGKWKQPEGCPSDQVLTSRLALSRGEDTANHSSTKERFVSELSLVALGLANCTPAFSPELCIADDARHHERHA